MKKNIYIQSLSRAVMALAVVGAMTSCAEDAGLFDIFQGGDGTGLSVAPVVSEPTVVTRAASVVTLKEEQLNTLDVFVEAVDNPGTFMKQYHLEAPTNEIGHQVQSLLADNWRAEGLEVGKNYNIYVATNNPKTTSDVASVEALKALTYDEVSAGVAVIADNGNVTWGESTTSGNIYKVYDANPGDARAVTSEKEFMMDGVLTNWTPNANSRDQIFQPVTLNRAAAKIVLNVDFDADFLKSLTQEKKTVDGVEKWVDKPAEKQVTITGSPAWKFYNFAFGAPVFAPATQGDPIEVHNSDFNIFHNHNFEGDDKHFQIITYTYPTKWLAADYTTKAPSLVISIPFTEGGVTNYHYYRIPIVKSEVTAIERNHIYVINATIATRGSELHEDEDEIEDLHYYVLPWNDETNSAAIKNEVEAVQHYYLKVNPKIYTLRGNGAQSVDINYLKASGTSVGWKLFTYDAQGNQTAVVANNADGATRAWFYNSTGAFTSTYSDTGSGINWGNTMGVTITQSTEGVSGSSGKFTVTSQALTNKAIKYIRFRVFLNEEETLYEDVIIRHFPTDNIQNIAGSWSSYHDANGATQTVTLTTTSLSEAQSWAEQYGVNYTTREKTITDYISYSEYNTHSSESGYSMTGPTTVTQNAFQTAVQGNTQRRNANSQANAVADAGEGHTYYWGQNPQESDYWNYDYYTPNYNLYKYQNYYSASYTHTYAQTEYVLTVQMASTGNWVDWDQDAYQTYSGNARKINANENFFAKVYNNGYVNAVVVNQSGNSKTYSLKYGSNTDYYYYWNGSSTQYMRTSFALTNNHMYVIQISSTSNSYILGRPVLGNPNENQSQDDVVSPAFMIASQLGAVTPYDNAANSAAHCRRYLEVAEDGTRYTGWRLPTQSEIKVIVGYQEGRINNVTIPSAYQTITPVLTGDLYWCLSGRKIRTEDNQVVTNGTAYLRCVRDLSAEEVERLNGFDKIVEKYQNK